MVESIFGALEEVAAVDFSRQARRGSTMSATVTARDASPTSRDRRGSSRSALPTPEQRREDILNKVDYFGLLEDVERKQERRRILEFLIGEKQESEEKVKKLDHEEKTSVLHDLATNRLGAQKFYFNRFEELCLFSILGRQQRLMELHEEIQYAETKGIPEETQNRLGKELKEYVKALDIFESLMKRHQPGFSTTRNTCKSLALALHEPQYWDSPDALNVCEISAVQKGGEDIDLWRRWLQRWCPRCMLDPIGLEQRDMDIMYTDFQEHRRQEAREEAQKRRNSGQRKEKQRMATDVNDPERGPMDEEAPMPGLERRATFAMDEEAPEPGIERRPTWASFTSWRGKQKKIVKLDAGKKRIMDMYRRRPLHISPTVDLCARVTVALVGGFLLLVPMVVLSFVRAFKWVLIITLAFTIGFSIALSLMSRATNDQMMVAAAAYGAVLVVFVANTVATDTGV